jgi:ankyrin repeat protein
MTKGSPVNISKNYYQNEFFINSRPLEELENEFLQNLGNNSIDEIISFLNLRIFLNKKDDLPIDDFSNKILRRIIAIHRDQSQNLKVENLAIILNNLATLGYKKNDLAKPEISEFIGFFNQNQNLTQKDISNFLKGLSRLHYDKDELNLNTNNLSNLISLKIGSFSFKQKVDFLNSLAHLGFDVNNSDINKISDSLINSMQNESLDAKQTTILIHSLAKMEMFDKLFGLRETLLQTQFYQKIDELNSDMSFSLLQTQMYCDLGCNQKFFSDEFISQIADKFTAKYSETSKLQQLIANSLPHNSKIEQEYSLHSIANKSVHDIDIMFTTTKQGDATYKYYIEIDGPTHFIEDSFGNLVANSATRKRDCYNQLAISRLDPVSRSFYLKLNHQETEANRQNLANFLATKLESAAEIAFDDSSFAMQKEGEKAESFASNDLSSLLVKADNSESFRASEITTQNSFHQNEAKKKKAKKKSKTKQTPEEEFKTAIANKNHAKIKELIANGIDVNTTLIAGLTPFNYAIQCSINDSESFGIYDNDYLITYNILAEAGADVSTISQDIIVNKALDAKSGNNEKSKNPKKNKPTSKKDSFNPLQEIFSYSAKIECETLFCKLAKVPNLKVENLLGPILQSGSIKMLEAVISHETFVRPSEAEQKRITRDTVSKCDPEALDILLLKGFEVDYSSVIERDFKNFINNILGNVNHNVENSKHEVPFFLSLHKEDPIFCLIILSNKEGIIESFIKKTPINSGINQQTNPSLLLDFASRISSSKIIELIIDSFPNVHKKIYKDTTPLIAACGHGNLEAVKTLLDRGADINQEDSKNFTPLIHACSNARIEVVKLLLDRGADIHKKDNKGCSCLFNACIDNHFDLVKLLLENGANPNQKDYQGLAPLYHCCQNNKIELTKLLLENGADSEKSTFNNFTPFHVAIKNNRLEIVQFFVNKKLLTVTDIFDPRLQAVCNKVSESEDKRIIEFFKEKLPDIVELLKKECGHIIEALKENHPEFHFQVMDFLNKEFPAKTQPAAFVSNHEAKNLKASSQEQDPKKPSKTIEK